MRFPIWLVILAALVAAGIIMVVGIFLINPSQPLLINANFTLSVISPNADGDDDITEFVYKITQNARVTLALQAEDGTVYYFREGELRSPGEYRVPFSGVVDGFLLPDEEPPGEVMRRLIPNGSYLWQFKVVGQDDDEVVEKTGTLVVKDADNPLPIISEFTVGPAIFTPNQDGVDDRVMINVFLEKESDLTVFLLDDEGRRLPITRREEGREVGEAGLHAFNYDGGVDNGIDPPPDGEYSIVARAQDAVGQVTQRTTMLTIRNGGKPRADIIVQPVGATVVFESQPYDERFYSYLNDEDELVLGDLVEAPNDPDSVNMLPITMRIGDMLVFKLTIENYGITPIRTSGPPPGTVYQQDQTSSALGQYDQSGVWRVGIECETSMGSYPYRWAIGTAENLITEVDPDNGNVYSYLPPGERSVVWGAIQMTKLVETRNPQDCWAGLIHEDVNLSQQNSNVGRRAIELVETVAEEESKSG